MTSTNNKQNIPLSIFIFTLAAFTLSQLVINSKLSPLGIELQSLNKEKNFLIEENRSMEEQIAKSNSITVIRKLADKELSLSSSNKKTIVYIEQKSIIAERQ